MLYRYKFVKDHKMHRLNQNFLFFIRNIRNVKNNAIFKPDRYFHPSFLNSKNKIAPHGKENKSLTVKFKAFFESFKLLSQQNKSDFYNIVLFANSLPKYFGDTAIDVSQMHTNNITRILGDNTFNELMTSLWDSLKSNSWEIDTHYKAIFDNIPNSKICPFCGIQQLANPRSFRADYDHLAYKASYPISAINLKNLAPSCADCNQKFKTTQDVFYSDQATRVNRRSFTYPYLNSVDIRIGFEDTVLPDTDVTNLEGTWRLNFTPNCNEVITWNSVYDISRRYIDEVLSVDYKTWIYNFVDEYKGRNINTEEALKGCFLKQFKRYHSNRLQKRYIIKSALYRFFFKCNNATFYNLLIKQLN